MSPIRIKDLRPYKDAEAIALSKRQRYNYIKLDCNEASYPPSPHVRARLLDFIENERLHWYPDTQSQDLKRKLCQYVGYPEEFIATFNGCDDALDSICRTYLSKGDEIIIFSPVYDNIRLFSELTGAQVIPYFSRTPFESDIEGVDQLINKKTKIIYLANPGNPTGATFTDEQIRKILSHQELMVVVDEAYSEFWLRTSLPLIREYPNLIITRSFSKAFGLAGLRCGYLVTNPSNMDNITKARNGKNVNVLAQVAAAAAIEDLAYIWEQIERMHKTKEWFVNACRLIGIKVVDTVVNFVLIQVRDAEKITEMLSQHNILVRNRSSFSNMEGFIRISIGSRSQMERLFEVLSLLTSDYFTDKSITQTVA